MFSITQRADIDIFRFLNKCAKNLTYIWEI